MPQNVSLYLSFKNNLSLPWLLWLTVGHCPHKVKGHQFDSRSGYMSGWWVWSPRGNWSMFLSLFSPSLPLSLNIKKKKILKKEKKRIFLFLLTWLGLKYFFFKRFLFIYFYKEEEGGRKGEKHQCVVAFWAPPTGGLAHNPSMCPDWKSNQWPLGSQVGTQSTEPL